MKKAGLLLALLCGVAVLLWFWSRPEPVVIALATVERGPVSATVSNTRAGTVDACRRAGLSPAMGGQITHLPIAEGDRVEPGQLLLELWNDDLAAELELALRDARAGHSRASEVCVLAEVAARESARLSRLMDQGLAAEETVDRAAGNAESRAAACAAAKDAALVNEARADVARAQLERTRLRAPFEGIVAEINGALGEFVTPSPVGVPTPPSIDLIDSSCLFISAPIDEIDAPAVRKGMPARITLDAFPGRTFPGHVRRVAPYVLDIEKQARTVEIEAEFDEPDEDTLLPGYSADVEVLLDERPGVLRIPTPILIDGQRVLVFDPVSGRMRGREIETGLANWEFTEVRSGLAEGEQVVSSIDRPGVADGALGRPE